MRFLVLLVALLAAPAAYSQSVSNPCAGFGQGSSACPYQWVGATSVAFTGNGNGLGFVGMTTQCRADFGPGARMCQSSEVLESDTLNLNAIPAAGCWVRPSWRPVASGSSGDILGLDESGQAWDARVRMTCSAWTATGEGSSGPVTGLVLSVNGGIEPAACISARPVACCKPIAVGEPQASLMLPTGVGILALLSMLKGGA